jgi:hypothetical protein
MIYLFKIGNTYKKYKAIVYLINKYTTDYLTKILMSRAWALPTLKDNTSYFSTVTNSSSSFSLLYFRRTMCDSSTNEISQKRSGYNVGKAVNFGNQLVA